MSARAEDIADTGAGKRRAPVRSDGAGRHPPPRPLPREVSLAKTQLRVDDDWEVLVVTDEVTAAPAHEEDSGGTVVILPEGLLYAVCGRRRRDGSMDPVQKRSGFIFEPLASVEQSAKARNSMVAALESELQRTERALHVAERTLSMLVTVYGLEESAEAARDWIRAERR